MVSNFGYCKNSALRDNFLNDQQQGNEHEMSKTRQKNENAVWIVIQSLLNEFGRGGEWYRHVEFDVMAIASRAQLSSTCVRAYLNKAVDDGRLAKYEVSGRSHVYMFEVYNQQ